MNKKRIWLILEIILIGALIVLLAILGGRIWQDRVYLKEQEEWKISLNIGKDELVPKNMDAERDQQAFDKLQSLRGQYKDVRALLVIPGTNIIYPVLQGEDNLFYLDHNKEGNYHPFGEVFLDSDNKANFMDRNSIIYGHNVEQAKTIFHELLNYRDQTFFDSHRDIYLYTLEGKKNYRVYSVFYAKPEEPYRDITFANSDDFRDFLVRYQGKSLIKADLPNLSETSRLLTLSTCFDNETRMVIQGIAS